MHSKCPEQPTYPVSSEASLITDIITKTCLYNFDHLKPHFYIVKMGYTLFFLFLLKTINCGYSLELPHQGHSNEYPQSMFWAEKWKISVFYVKIFSFFGGEIYDIFEQACFRNNSIFFVWQMSLNFVHQFFWQNSICKQWRPRSDNSWRSSLIRVYTVCYSTKYLRFNCISSKI